MQALPQAGAFTLFGANNFDLFKATQLLGPEHGNSNPRALGLNGRRLHLDGFSSVRGLRRLAQLWPLQKPVKLRQPTFQTISRMA